MRNRWRHLSARLVGILERFVAHRPTRAEYEVLRELAAPLIAETRAALFRAARRHASLAILAIVAMASMASANPGGTFHPTQCPIGQVAAVMTTATGPVGGCYDAGTPQPQPPATAFIMAPGGNDAAAGTIDAPVATREGCRALMRAPGAAFKTCQIRGGEYVVTATFVLDQRDAGETWTNYPGESPHFTEPAGLTVDWLLLTGADGITVSGLSATGTQAKAAGACGVNDWIRVSSDNHAANLTLTGNKLDHFGCVTSLFYITNASFTGNWINDAGYVALNCNACTGGLVDGNRIWNVGLDLANSTQYRNAYPVSLSTGSSPPYVTTGMKVTNNIIVNTPYWQCLDNHGADGVEWSGNLCVLAGKNNFSNHAAIDSLHPQKNVVVRNNIYDYGAWSGPLITSVAMCGTVPAGQSGCANATDNLAGGRVERNYVLAGKGNGCILQITPTVAVDNPRDQWCDREPEAVVSISIKGGGVFSGAQNSGGNVIQLISSGNFAANQPGAPVAELTVNMSDTIWPFPAPPGRLSISGTNSGGFVICNQVQLCQPAAGTPVGTYADFSITAAMDGMKSSPYTQASGTLQLVGR